MKGQAWRWLAMPIALLAIVALGTGQPSHDGRRELGGAVDGMVALINASSPTNDIYNAQFCGGVVVELRLVLTAAHCVAMRSAASIDVVIGGDNLCRDRPIDGLRFRLSGVRIHPAYDALSARFDLAVLVLAVDAPPDSIRDVASAPPCRLMRTDLRLLPQPECAARAGASDRAYDPASMLCAIPDQIRPRTLARATVAAPWSLAPTHGGQVASLPQSCPTEENTCLILVDVSNPVFRERSIPITPLISRPLENVMALAVSLVSVTGTADTGEQLGAEGADAAA